MFEKFQKKICSSFTDFFQWNTNNLTWNELEFHHELTPNSCYTKSLYSNILFVWSNNFSCILYPYSVPYVSNFLCNTWFPLGGINYWFWKWERQKQREWYLKITYAQNYAKNSIKNGLFYRRFYTCSIRTSGEVEGLAITNSLKLLCKLYWPLFCSFSVIVSAHFTQSNRKKNFRLTKINKQLTYVESNSFTRSLHFFIAN